MSEIEKMYARAMIKPLSITVCGVDEQIINYPPFTAEKQLSLIKWLMHKASFHAYYSKLETDSNDYVINYCTVQYHHNKLESALSALIIDIWQDLTEEEKQQIKEILE